MTTPSHFSETGIAIYANEPLLFAATMKFQQSLSQMVNGYSHIIAANGGYKSASISMTMQQEEIEGWIENGLGRNITVYNEGQQPIWNGFVNDIEVSMADLTITLNCLGYIEWLKAYTYNSTTAATTTINAAINAVLVADPNNIISSDYTKLTANTFSIPSYTNDDNLALDYINGLVAMGDAAFNRYLFGVYANQRAEYTVMPTVNEYIAQVSGLNVKRGPLLGIANKVAIVYSTVDTSVTPPAVGVRKKTAYAIDIASQNKYGIIEKILSSGGSTDANATNIRDTYIGDAHEPETTQTITINAGEITTPQGRVIEPWNVLPAKWAFIPNFMIGRIPDTTAMRDDMRYLFIESLTFTAPYGLILTGAKISKLPQILGQLGLLGVGI